MNTNSIKEFAKFFDAIKFDIFKLKLKDNQNALIKQQTNESVNMLQTRLGEKNNTMEENVKFQKELNFISTKSEELSDEKIEHFLKASRRKILSTIFLLKEKYGFQSQYYCKISKQIRLFCRILSKTQPLTYRTDLSKSKILEHTPSLVKLLLIYLHDINDRVILNRALIYLQYGTPYEHLNMVCNLTNYFDQLNLLLDDTSSFQKMEEIYQKKIMGIKNDDQLLGKLKKEHDKLNGLLNSENFPGYFLIEDYQIRFVIWAFQKEKQTNEEEYFEKVKFIKSNSEIPSPLSFRHVPFKSQLIIKYLRNSTQTNKKIILSLLSYGLDDKVSSYPIPAFWLSPFLRPKCPTNSLRVCIPINEFFDKMEDKYCSGMEDVDDLDRIGLLNNLREKINKSTKSEEELKLLTQYIKENTLSEPIKIEILKIIQKKTRSKKDLRTNLQISSESKDKEIKTPPLTRKTSCPDGQIRLDGKGSCRVLSSVLELVRNKLHSPNPDKNKVYTSLLQMLLLFADGDKKVPYSKTLDEIAKCFTGSEKDQIMQYMRKKKVTQPWYITI